MIFRPNISSHFRNSQLAAIKKRKTFQDKVPDTPGWTLLFFQKWPKGQRVASKRSISSWSVHMTFSLYLPGSNVIGKRNTPLNESGFSQFWNQAKIIERSILRSHFPLDSGGFKTHCSAFRAALSPLNWSSIFYFLFPFSVHHSHTRSDYFLTHLFVWLLSAGFWRSTASGESWTGWTGSKRCLDSL